MLETAQKMASDCVVIRGSPIADELYDLIHSNGKVNIADLAKNAGTSVDQIERFYPRHLQLSREMTISLQSFGEQG
jgi:hypothetical protein